MHFGRKSHHERFTEINDEKMSNAKDNQFSYIIIASNVSERHENLLSGTIFSFIHIMYFHFPFTVMGLDMGLNKGPVSTVSLHLVHLKGNIFNQNILPDAYKL